MKTSWAISMPNYKICNSGEYSADAEFWAVYRPEANSDDDNTAADARRSRSNVDEFTSGVAGINPKTRGNPFREGET